MKEIPFKTAKLNRLLDSINEQAETEPLSADQVEALEQHLTGEDWFDEDWGE